MRGAGFVKYLPKPIDHEALIRAISTAVARTPSR
jgi:CheY-like chemotaxis protein